MLVGCASDGVTAQHNPVTVGSYEMSDRAAGEVAADSMEHNPGQHLGLLVPDRDHWIVPQQPLAVCCLHIDRYAAESVRPSI